MRYPISLYVAYHTNNKEGFNIYNKLYNDLCRDSASPLSDGLDIPVFFLRGDDNGFINNIDKSKAEKTCLLLLIDDEMYLSNVWREFIKSEISAAESNKGLFLIPVSQSKHAYEINKRLQHNQFIALKEYSVINCWDEFLTRLYDVLIRNLRDDLGQKINIFISHSKKDLDNKGEKLAIQLRDYLRSETKLGSFFDVNDILDGVRFDYQIESNAERSILIVLFTNTYSSREWCRREILHAKKYKMPTVAVFLVDGDIDRVFPYIGNIPSTIYNGNWRTITNMLLRTALDQFNEKALLSKIVEGDEDADYIPFPPEAHSYSIIEKSKKTILYPEPPLGNEELEVLKRINNDVFFYTPMQYKTKNIDFKQMSVAVSISESRNLEFLGMGNTVLNDLMVEISRHLLITNARLVYGGDLRNGGFTHLFKELSYQYGLLEKSDSDAMYFTNYFAWPIHLNLKIDDAVEFKHSRVNVVKVEAAEECKEMVDVNKFLPPSSPENLFLWARSLTKMRMEMERAVGARILVGGRLSNFKGCMAGLLEEFQIARSMNHPVYLVGGFGGVTGMLVDIIEGKVTSKNLLDEAQKDEHYPDLLKIYEQKGMPVDYSEFDGITKEHLNTGLGDEDLEVLFHSTNIMEIVSLILKGLKNKYANE